MRLARERGESVARRPGPYRAPSARGIMREADFDDATEVAGLVGRPLPAPAAGPGGGLARGGLALDLDVAGRVRESPGFLGFWRSGRLSGRLMVDERRFPVQF